MHILLGAVLFRKDENHIPAKILSKMMGVFC